jgi:hypothetical protein
MALTDDMIAAIERMLGAGADAAGLDAMITGMRAALPGVVLLRCDASDVLEEPYREFEAVDLHLIDARNHCTTMTASPDAATGVLLAIKAPPS